MTATKNENEKPEEIPTVDEFDISPKKIPKYYSGKADHEELVKQILEENRLVFKTTINNEFKLGVDEYNFYKLYHQKVAEIGDEPRKRSTINNYFKELEEAGDVIHFDDEVFRDWFIEEVEVEGEVKEKWREDIPRHLHFTRTEIKDILRGRNEFVKHGGLVFDKLPSNFRPRLFISSSGENKGRARQVLISEVTAILESIQITSEETERKKTISRYNYLATFNKQPIHAPSISPISIKHYFLDLLDYVSHSLQRVCPSCGYRMGSPYNSDVARFSEIAEYLKMPIGSFWDRLSFKDKKDIISLFSNFEQEAIALARKTWNELPAFRQLFEVPENQSGKDRDEPAINSSREGLAIREEARAWLEADKSELEDDEVEALETLPVEYKEIISSKSPGVEQKEVMRRIENMLVISQWVAKGFTSAREIKGGTKGIFSPSEGINLPPDVEVIKLTKIADQYVRNTRDRCITLQDFLDDNVGQAKTLAEMEFRDAQNEYREMLKCPICGNDEPLVKPRLFYVSDFLERGIMARIQGLTPIYVGIPGGGKSEICNQFHDYLQWLYGVDHIVFGINEKVTTGQLTGRINLKIVGDPDAVKVEYGILTRCLFKEGYRDAGMEMNLTLDEMNRTDFKHLAFLMSFLESPYYYTIDDDNFRMILYPNRENHVVWSLQGTMNTADIGNERIPVAAKQRFVFIEVDYSNEQMKGILKRSFNLETKPGAPLDHWVINYLMIIYEFTKEFIKKKYVKFPAGVRLLIRVHKVFNRAARLYKEKYRINDINVDEVSFSKLPEVGVKWEKEKGKISEFNMFYATREEELEKLKTIGGVAMETFLKSIFDKIVRDYVLYPITDESTPQYQESVFKAWDNKLNTQTELWGIIQPHLDEL